ncbi:hypothetical protein NKR23_g667 [Pleurostoma richardsiae]|uniref:Uncharacterized protein n=1 Tax=Pleurostoma richardsiae TaxID=41990 RepID=A0AA38W0W1_9PEZI|nr:hypothetical protein NKR23_g667 [Pleurostoma richardsiae]
MRAGRSGQEAVSVGYHDQPDERILATELDEAIGQDVRLMGRLMAHGHLHDVLVPPSWLDWNPSHRRMTHQWTPGGCRGSCLKDLFNFPNQGCSTRAL